MDLYTELYMDFICRFTHGFIHRSISYIFTPSILIFNLSVM